MQRKALIGMILAIVALLLIAMSMVMPWYSLKVKASMSGVSSEMEMNWYLDHSEIKALDETQTFNYDDESAEESEALSVFRTTRLFVYLGLVGCILGLVGAILVMTDKMSNKMGAIFVLIALILALLAPFYMMFILPGAFKTDLEESGASEVLPSGMSDSFFGSQEQSISGVSTEYSWGGGTGWIFALIAFFLILIALILVGRSSPAPLPMAQPQQPYQPVTQPVYQPPPTQPQPQQPYTPQQPPPSPPPQDPSYPPPPPPP